MVSWPWLGTLARRPPLSCPPPADKPIVTKGCLGVTLWKLKTKNSEVADMAADSKETVSDVGSGKWAALEILSDQLVRTYALDMVGTGTQMAIYLGGLYYFTASGKWEWEAFIHEIYSMDCWRFCWCVFFCIFLLLHVSYLLLISGEVHIHCINSSDIQPKKNKWDGSNR